MSGKIGIESPVSLPVDRIKQRSPTPAKRPAFRSTDAQQKPKQLSPASVKASDFVHLRYLGSTKGQVELRQSRTDHSIYVHTKTGNYPLKSGNGERITTVNDAVARARELLAHAGFSAPYKASEVKKPNTVLSPSSGQLRSSYQSGADVGVTHPSPSLGKRIERAGAAIENYGNTVVDKLNPYSQDPKSGVWDRASIGNMKFLFKGVAGTGSALKSLPAFMAESTQLPARAVQHLRGYGDGRSNVLNDVIGIAKGTAKILDHTLAKPGGATLHSIKNGDVAGTVEHGLEFGTNAVGLFFLGKTALDAMPKTAARAGVSAGAAAKADELLPSIKTAPTPKNPDLSIAKGAGIPKISGYTQDPVFGASFQANVTNLAKAIQQGLIKDGTTLQNYAIALRKDFAKAKNSGIEHLIQLRTDPMNLRTDMLHGGKYTQVIDEMLSGEIPAKSFGDQWYVRNSGKLGEFEIQPTEIYVNKYDVNNDGSKGRMFHNIRGDSDAMLLFHDHNNKLVKQLFNADLTHNQFMDLLAKKAWLDFNVMPVERGTAAIKHMELAAIATSRGIDNLAYTTKNTALDLKALTRDMDQFVKEFPSFFE